MKIKNIKRDNILRYGRSFFIVGIVLMAVNYPLARFIGATEIFIGSLFLIIYNSEKYKYLKLLHISLLKRGYKVSFDKQRWVCLLLCVTFFFCNSASWTLLLRLEIISKLAYNVVGAIFILLLLPIVFPPDDIDKQLADETAEKLIDFQKK